MAVLAVLSTPNTEAAPDSTPRRIVSELPAMEIEVVQFERRGSVAVPYLWMWEVSPAEFESVLRDDPQIVSVRQLERTEDGAFYKAKWNVDSPVIYCVANTNGVVIQAQGTVEEWQLKIWFEDGADASAFQQCCRNRDIPLQVDRLSSLAELLDEDSMNISTPQHEVLTLAYREGYFDEPRRVSQEDLAAEFGVSSSAIGRRLRRGIRALIEETLTG